MRPVALIRTDDEVQRFHKSNLERAQFYFPLPHPVSLVMAFSRLVRVLKSMAVK